MGGKDSPPPQSAPLQFPKWEEHKSATLGRKLSPIEYVPRSRSAVNLDMGYSSVQREIRKPPQWHSSTPEQEPRSSSCSRSDGTISPIRQYMECIEPQTLSCAIVGDSGVGKTSLLLSYTTGKISETHNPTIYDKFSSSISVYGKRIQVTLCDTSGQDEFSHLRPLCYPQVDAVLMCFSVVDSASYENIKSKWSREIKHHCPGVPIILVGTQIDLRENPVITKHLKSRGLRTVSRSDGNKLASLIRANTYLECSALKQLNVKNAFDEAIAAALELGNGKITTQCVSAPCTIL